VAGGVSTPLRRLRRRWPAGAAGQTATAGAAGALVATLWLAGAGLVLRGGYALPLERPYALLAEARALAEGSLPEPGHGLLWQTLLVPGATFADGAHAHLWLAALAVAVAGAVAAATWTLAVELAGPPAGAAAVALVLANGWFLHASLAGLPTGLVAALLLAAALALVRGRLVPAAAALSALVLTAPWLGAAALVGAVAVALRRRPEALAAAAPPLLALAAVTRGAVSPLLEPEPAASVLRDPSRPLAGRVATWLGEASSGFGETAVRNALYLVPVVVVGAALAGGALLARRSRGAAAILAVAGLASLAAAGTTGWGADRGALLAALVPAVAALAATAVAALAPRPAAVAAALAAVTALVLPAWWGDFVNAGSQLARVQVSFARATAAEVAPGLRIAIDRPGPVGFYAGSSLDLSGALTPPLREAAQAGTGAVWEALERLPEAERPDLLAISLDRAPALGGTGFVGEAFVERRIEYTEPRFQDTTFVLTLYAADWATAGLGDELPAALGRGPGTTAVDVGDLQSEREAGYRRRWHVPSRDRSAEVSLHARPTVVGATERAGEGCRLVAEETFVTDAPGSTLVGRFVGPARLAVSVDGGEATSVEVPDDPEAFGYALVPLPAGDGPRVVTVAGAGSTSYTSCRYWVA
jgi:hypothetical protein